MTRIAAIICFGCALLAVPALAVPGGKLSTLERGTWVCEMPGDAATARGVPVPEAGFEITRSSNYRTPAGRGTYLRTGDQVTLTSGPRKGESYSLENEHFLRKLDADGKETGLRCIKLGAAGITAPNPSAPCKDTKQEDAERAGNDSSHLAKVCDGDETASS